MQIGTRESAIIDGKEITIGTGRMARQADGAVTIQTGETICLVTAVASRQARVGMDFLPLTCDYIEKSYSAGRIPGSFFRREGRPAEREILVARLIDRPCRPLFPKTWRNETQLISTVLSMDGINPADVLSITGASCALHISDIPFAGPIAGIRVGYMNGKFIANPTFEESENCDLDVIMAVSRDSIIMVEGSAKFVDEDLVVESLLYGHSAAAPLLDMQDRLRAAIGKEKRPTPEEDPVDEALVQRVHQLAVPMLAEALSTTEKQERYIKIDNSSKEVLDSMEHEYPEREAEVSKAFSKLKKKMMRDRILDEGIRIDGRGPTDIRDINCDTTLLPRAHGSSLFTRGETQALVTVTFGTKHDEQRIDALSGEYFEKFMLHYNFPPFCVGEARFLRGTSRREIGHGNLARRALKNVLPEWDDFPYTIRIVSEVLESNGSSSMASVCGGSLALMDAGAPIKAAVAGIAMGLIKEQDKIAILTDILGDEDHLGDMDFKLAGTRDGITALQMDIKIAGIERDILKKALYQARDARLNILDTMDSALSQARTDLSPHAPRIFTIHIKPERIKDVIGPGGKIIKAIIEETGVIIDVDDSGRISVASPNVESAEKAIAIIKSLTEEPEQGRIYKGKVVKTMDFGAFVEILPGTDGLCHISELDLGRVNQTTDVVNEGDEIQVKVLAIDKQGKIRLSRREAIIEIEGLPPQEQQQREPSEQSGSRERSGRGGGGGNRGGRGDDRGPRRPRGGRSDRPRSEEGQPKSDDNKESQPKPDDKKGSESDD